MICYFSMISNEAEELVKWMCDSVGSRVIEEGILSETIQFKLKWKLIKVIKGHYSVLAKDRFGSHVFDKLWNVSDIALKVLLSR